MSLSTNKALIKLFVEGVFNNHDLSAIEKYLADTIQGKEGFKQSLSVSWYPYKNRTYSRQKWSCSGIP